MNRFYQKEVESATECILPDYLGDVKKVLSVSASATPSGRFAGEENVEFSGNVVYDVIYTDAEGVLTSFTTTSDYDFSVPIENERYVDSAQAPMVSNAVVRFTGPRKLSAKSCVTSSVLLSLEDEGSAGGDAFDLGTVETDTRNIKEEHMIFGTSVEREYAEEASRLADVSADEIEIIVTSGAVKIYESMPEDGGIRVKGEMIITSIIKTDTQPPFAIRKAIPFDELVPIEGVSPNMQALANGYITSAVTGISEDDDGCVLTVNAIAEYNCFAAENKCVDIVCDAYLKERDTEVKCENLTYSELVCMGNCEREFSASVARADIGLEEIRDVISVSCELQHVEKAISSRGLEISGDAAIYGVACQINEANQPKYIPFKINSPFAVNVNTSCQIPENATVDLKASVTDVRESIDLEKIGFKCTVSAAYHVYLSPCIRRVSECNVIGDAEYGLSPSTVTVYYPDADETLFEVAKKFHTSREKIAADSALSVETLSRAESGLAGVKRLIIK